MQNDILKFKISGQKQILTSFIIFVFGILLVYFLWRQAIILTLFLILLAFAKHKIIPIKKELTIFIISGLVGALAECVVIFSGAWSYANPQIINFPLWLLFLWGLAGITGVSFYLGL